MSDLTHTPAAAAALIAELRQQLAAAEHDRDQATTDLNAKLAQAEQERDAARAALAAAAAGPVFTNTKEIKEVSRYQTADGMFHATPDEAKRHLKVQQLVDIGGITPAQAGRLVDAGLSAAP